MVCESCGDAPKLGGDKNFTKSVIEINNPERLVLFRKVVIPASMGDDETFPPEVGKYYNVLAVYEANKHAYLYSSDGIPTELTSEVAKELEEKIDAIDARVDGEITARTNADNALSNDIGIVANNLSTEVTNRENAVRTVADNLDTEVTNRTNADTALSGDIAAETLARQNADAALSNDITAEANTRSSADTTLQNNINAEAATRLTNDTAISNSLANETAARIVAEENLQNSINAASSGITTERTARIDADNAINLRIDGLSGDLSDESTARVNADNALGTRIDDVNAIASTAVQPTTIDKTVVSNISMSATPSTTTVEMSSSKVNILSGNTSTSSIALPVASSSQAGVINSATYDAIQDNSNNINALLNGAVAVTGLPASPTQAQVTTAWQTETGLTTLVNRASVYDVTNNKVWTYYTNDSTWHAASNTSQVTVSTFTNSSEGVIKGSTTAGQVYAESNGTGSVNGWDTLTTAVNNATTKLATIANGAEVNVQSDWNQTSTSADDYIKNKPTIPTVNNATLTIQKNGASVGAFTANASSNVTANITVPTKVSDLNNDAGYTTNTGTITKVQANGTDVASSGTANIPAATTAVYGVTKLSTATNSTSNALAATASAVKAAYDLAASKGTGTITAVQANGTSVATSGTANIPAASTSAYGVTKLTTAVNSTSTALAATASAVKSAYDLAATKAKITVQSTDPGEGATLAAGEFIAVYSA